MLDDKEVGKDMLVILVSGFLHYEEGNFVAVADVDAKRERIVGKIARMLKRYKSTVLEKASYTIILNTTTSTTSILKDAAIFLKTLKSRLLLAGMSTSIYHINS